MWSSSQGIWLIHLHLVLQGLEMGYLLEHSSRVLTASTGMLFCESEPEAGCWSGFNILAVLPAAPNRLLKLPLIDGLRGGRSSALDIFLVRVLGPFCHAGAAAADRRLLTRLDPGSGGAQWPSVDAGTASRRTQTCNIDTYVRMLYRDEFAEQLPTRRDLGENGKIEAGGATRFCG